MSYSDIFVCDECMNSIIGRARGLKHVNIKEANGQERTPPTNERTPARAAGLLSAAAGCL